MLLMSFLQRCNDKNEHNDKIVVVVVVWFVLWSIIDAFARLHCVNFRFFLFHVALPEFSLLTNQTTNEQNNKNKTETARSESVHSRSGRSNRIRWSKRHKIRRRRQENRLLVLQTYVFLCCVALFCIVL